MKAPSIAVLLGKGPSKDDDYKRDEGASEEEYMSYAQEAFPDEEWTPERVKALKQFVMACMD